MTDNLNFNNLLDVIIFRKQINGIIINFWSKYKQHELKKVDVNKNKWILCPSLLSFFKKLFKDKKANNKKISPKFSSNPQ